VRVNNTVFASTDSYLLRNLHLSVCYRYLSSKIVNIYDLFLFHLQSADACNLLIEKNFLFKLKTSV
jgi:hypothetical protein